jgi:hypothetical protein
MTEQYEYDIINQKLQDLELIIVGLQEGLALFEWTKEEPDTRAQELQGFLSQKEALVAKRNTLK